MTIHTPSDLATYLIALATHHPEVRNVVYGEHSRVEDGTLATAEYPQVDIETPMATVPVDQGQARMSTRIYVVSATPSGTFADQDISHDTTYRIARDLVHLVMKHSDSGLIDIEMDVNAPIQFKPIVASGSDQQRGWMFQMEFLLDSHRCSEGMDTIIVPQFSWRIDEGMLITEDLTYGSTSPGVEYAWFKQDQSETSATEIQVAEPIDISAMDPAEIYIRLWLRVTHGSHILWAYAQVMAGRTTGRSTLFVPSHPQ